MNSAEGRTWRPLLGGAATRRAREAIEDIASAIPRRLPASTRRQTSAIRRATPNASLADGDAGLAVFYSYLARSGFGNGAERKARRFLKRAADAVESVSMGPSLYSGFAGIVWAMAHLEPRIGEAYSTEAVGEALANLVRLRPWKADYDLIVGLVGMGVYALERLPAAAAVACLEGVVDRLAEICRRRSGGVAWHTGPELLPPHQLKECPRGYDNIGLAHGVPGVIALLAAAWAAGVRRRKARMLLDGAVVWLLQQERKGQEGSRFPAWIAPGAKSESTRTAWCYGDAGVAAALFAAARCVGEPDWEKKALEIAIAAASRPPEQAGVADAGLCHGAAGLAHIFNRFYQATGEATFCKAARFWFERTLAMREPGRGIGGFSALAAREDGTRYWEADPGILTGSAGIALALLAAATPIEPEWDRMLLVSTRNHG